MIRNPELTRNLWLEITTHRLIAMPLILGVIFLLAHVAGHSPQGSLRNIVNISSFAYIILVMIWGAKNAASSIIDEVNQNTWDFQKLSSITPWKMVVGKFIGSTLYMWYGGIIALSVYALASISLNSSINASLFYPVIKTSLLLLTGILVQLAAMFLAIASLAINKSKPARLSSLAFVIASFLASIPLLSYTLSLGHRRRSFQGSIDWYDLGINYTWFTLVTLIIFIGWTCTGIYRLMKKELQYPLLPWVWTVFTCFIVIFLQGFFIKTPPTVSLLLPLFLLTCITYLLLLAEAKTGPIYKKLYYSFKSRKWTNIFAATPLWVITSMLVIAYSVLLCAVTILSLTEVPKPSFLIATVIVTLLLLSRDILIVHFFNLPPNRKRADMTAIIYMIVLYFLLPWLCLLMDNFTLANILVPIPISEFPDQVTQKSIGISPLQAVIAAIAQSMIAALLFFRRLKKIKKMNANSND